MVVIDTWSWFSLSSITIRVERIMDLSVRMIFTLCIRSGRYYSIPFFGAVLEHYRSILCGRPVDPNIGWKQSGICAHGNLAGRT